MLQIYDFNNWVRKYIHAGADMRAFITEIAKTSEHVPMIWVCDGFNCNERRRKIYPEYKKSREAPGEDVFAFMDFIKEALRFTNALRVEVPYYEADDVIAYLAPKYRPCKVFSTDADLWALKIHKGIELPARESFHCEPHLVHLYKAIVGDKSDNIPGVRGVGHATFTNWVNFEKEVPSKIEEAAEEVEKFLKITQFILPPEEEIDKHTYKGTLDYDALEKLMNEAGLVGSPVNKPNSFDIGDI